MKNWTKSLLLALIATTAIACVQNDPISMGQNNSDDPETEAFRQGLIGPDDIEMTFDANNGTRNQALAGQASLIALLTVDAVVNTNLFLVNHLVAMRFITALPPTASADDMRMWQGENDGLTMRVVVDRSLTPRGVRFDYIVAAKPVDADEDAFLPLIDGHIVRIDTRPQELGRQGFGIVRFNFTNINTLNPDEEIGGIARIAFRKVGNVKQVHSRLLNVVTPNDPDFPKAAEYAYTLLPNGAGGMKWFSVGDVQKDGPPYENVAAHSLWREDHSGVGSATVFGGSIDVDYWHLGECWSSNLLKGYERLAIPGMMTESGDATTCFNTPDDLEVPDFQESLPDEDPQIPAAHPDEE